MDAQLSQPQRAYAAAIERLRRERADHMCVAEQLGEADGWQWALAAGYVALAAYAATATRLTETEDYDAILDDLRALDVRHRATGIDRRVLVGELADDNEVEKRYLEAWLRVVARLAEHVRAEQGSSSLTAGLSPQDAER